MELHGAQSWERPMRSKRCGMTTRKAENFTFLLTVKNVEDFIQDAHDFFAWAKGTEETSAIIRFRFLFSEDCANAASFLTEACEDIKLAAEVVCCASCMQGTTCEGRRLVNLKETTLQPQEA